METQTTQEMLKMARELNIELRHISEPEARTSITLQHLDAKTVKDLVIADSDLWLETVLPAIVEGVFDAADWITWNGPPGSANKAICLVQAFGQLARVKHFIGGGE